MGLLRIRPKIDATDTQFQALARLSLTVTMFEAVKTPVEALLCGAEGGMQRAIACSYDWTTGAYYRETVLRMETPVLEKMSRVERFRFGMNRAS